MTPQDTASLTHSHSRHSHRHSHHSHSSTIKNGSAAATTSATSSSFLARLSKDAANAFQDAYGNFVLGDDAGKSARLVLVLKPPTQLGRTIELGMTFVEINGRAYVKSVQPQSQAARAGVMPKDAIQFASLYHTDFDHAAAAAAAVGGGSTSTAEQQEQGQQDQHDQHDDYLHTDLDEAATSYALACEARGMRISYDDLRILLQDGLDPMQSAFLSPPTSSATPKKKNGGSNKRSSSSSKPSWTGPPIPSTINVCAPHNDDVFLHSPYFGSHPDHPHDSRHRHDTTPHEELFVPYSGDTPKPIVLVFRRTRQRALSTRTAHSASLVPCGVQFRMDDECDFAAALLRKLAPTQQDVLYPYVDATATGGGGAMNGSFTHNNHNNSQLPMPDAWDELLHDGTDWFLGQGTNNNSNNTADSSGMSQRLVQSQPQAPQYFDDSGIPLDDYEKERSMKMAQLQSRMVAEQRQQQATAAASEAHAAHSHSHHHNGGATAAAGQSSSVTTALSSPSPLVDNVEAATIRGMIQKAVGLAFVRASKIVLGISLHGGSGICIARLGDGTWSAPLAIGTWGLGFGIQFGLEVAEYIFILQTEESLQHFRNGSSFTIGGNIGAALAGMGREAYGAASIGNPCLPLSSSTSRGSLLSSSSSANAAAMKEDEYNDDEDSNDLQLHGGVDDGMNGGDGLDVVVGSSGGGIHKSSNADHHGSGSGGGGGSFGGVAPIVAYAKSQGLYIGVSLEGSRFFTRHDVNARAYKFTTGRDVTANDILSGKVATPPEAEDMYAALHSVEFTHEMSCLPRPPEILRKDSANPWQYNRSTLGSSSSGYSSSGKDPFPFLKQLGREEEEECESFETQFKKFMYGGVSVQRLLPHAESSSTGKTRKERRTLWLMLPEVGALRLGFVSKLSDGEGAVSNKSSTQRLKRDTGDSSLLGWEGDLATVASEEITLDSVLLEKDAPSGQIRTGDVQLSNKHSLALTDVTILSQQANVPINFSSDDKTEHLRVISIQDVSGTSLLFLANNFREAELLVCGLKLLLERETARLGVRGGLPITALGGKAAEGAMSPAAARGFKEPPSSDKSSRHSRRGSGYASSELGDESTIGTFSTLEGYSSIPEGRKKWGNVPGRDYMREKAAAASPTGGLDSSSDYGSSRNGIAKYKHGRPIVRDIATNVHLPLPLPLCRVLLLDSSSPVIEKWEQDRGDRNFSRTNWTFPPATPRELERHSSEHQLIASGSMMGAHRTTSFDRMRNGSLVHLSETQIIDADDSEKLAFTISERMPRRGFSMKVKFVLRSSKDNSCEATVIGEVRPVGKNMSNQAAVHKAFLLVLNELKTRYGSDGRGLISSFLSVVSSLPNPESAVAAVGKNGRRSSRGRAKSAVSSPFRRTMPSMSASSDSSTAGSTKPRKQRPESGLVSFDDIMNASHDLPPPSEPVRRKEEPTRPATPSLQQIAVSDPNLKKLTKAEKEKKYLEENEFAELPIDEQEDLIKSQQPKTIEVKPLPKIRLSLMPAPREEDEDMDSDKSPGAKKKKKKSSSSSRRSLSNSSSGRKSSRR